MSSAFDKRVPESPSGKIIKPQRPSFAAIGWSTVHIPMEEMIEYAQLRATGEIIRNLGVHESGASSEEVSLKEINEYFFTPKKGAEKERFIDITGLSRIIDASYWNNRAGLPQAGQVDAGTGRIEIYDLGLFKKELLVDMDETEKTKELMKGSRGEIMSYAGKAMTGDLDQPKLDRITGEFLKTYLSVEEVPSELKEESRLGEGVRKAMERGPHFALEGLEDLLEDLSILKDKTNYKLEELAGKLDKFTENRTKGYQDLEELESGIGAGIQWLLRRRQPVADALEEFLIRDRRCKRFAFQEGVLTKIVNDIIPAYEDQVGKWYNRILGMSRKLTDDLMPAVKRLKRQALHTMGASTNCEFNIDFSKMRDRFYGQFRETVRLREIIKEIRVQGLKLGSPPKAVPFIDALQSLTSKEMIDGIRKIIESTTTELKQIEGSEGKKTNLFRLNFDDFTGTDKENCLFWDNAPGGDIQTTHGKLGRHGAIMTNLEDPSGIERVYNICDSQVWKERLGGESLKGLYPHKVTHLEMRLGFAPFQLFYLKEWYKDYRELQDWGWPLHIFEGAEDWNEPYAQYNYEKQPDNLFTLACNSDYGRFIQETGDGSFLVRHVRSDRFQGGYCRFTILDNRADIIEEIRSNGDIYGELCRRVLKRLVLSRDTDRIPGFIEEGLIPAELLEDLRESIDLPRTGIKGVPFKNPEGLFDLAVELNEAWKVEGEDLFELKVIFRPGTEECDFSVKEDKGDIISELAVNEPFYERLCYKMVMFVEQTRTGGEEKLALLKKLFPLLPPQMREPLEDKYPEIGIE